MSVCKQMELGWPAPKVRKNLHINAHAICLKGKSHPQLLINLISKSQIQVRQQKKELIILY